MDTPKEVMALLDEYGENVSYNISSVYDENVEDQSRFTYAGIEQKEDKLIVHKLVPWLGCRGYMCEALYGTSNGSKFRLSGMDYYAKSIHNGASMLLVKNIGPAEMESAVNLLNRLEDGAGWELSLFKEIVYSMPQSEWGMPNPPKKKAYFWVGDHRWFTSTIYVSLLCLLIRLCAKRPFAEEETFAEWATEIEKAGSSEEDSEIRPGDRATLRELFKYHSNAVEILLGEHESLTEKLNYKKHRDGGHPQQAGQEAGISSSTYYANLIALEKESAEWWDKKLSTDYYHRINDSMIYRFGIALGVLGDGKQMLKPKPRTIW